MSRSTWSLILAIIVTLVASTGPAMAQRACLQFIYMEPAVIPSSGGSPVFLTVKTSAPATSVELELDGGGGTLPMMPVGSDIFSTTVDSASLLAGYGPEDVFRNLAGHINVTDLGGQVCAINFVVNVDDPAIATVPVSDVAFDVRCSPHVVNILLPDGDPWGPVSEPGLTAQDEAATSRFYDLFGDDFEFASLVQSVPSRRENRGHYVVKNEVMGIGIPPLDDTAAFGSSGSLLGITRFPLDTFFDLAETTSLHELGHQWINFLSGSPLLGPAIPHWPASTLAHGIMGTNLPGSIVGGTFNFDLAPLGGSDYQVLPSPPLREFSKLDLYLMGLLPDSGVGSFVVVDPPSQPIADFAIVTGTTLSISDVLAAAGGPRVPDSAASPSAFRVANVVVSRIDLLTDREMAFFDHFAARGEEAAPVPFHIGLESGVTKPFALATQGLGSLVTEVVCPTSTPPPPEPGGEVEGPRETKCPKVRFPFCPEGIPPLMKGLDFAVIAADIQPGGARTSLRAKVVHAGEAYVRGNLEAAAQELAALLGELAASTGRSVPARTARSLETLTRQAAASLGIPLPKKS